MTELAKNDYSFYCEYVHRGEYRPARHLDLIAAKLTDLALGEFNKVMFLLPPRHGKSMTVTESFPSYFIGKDPSRRVIAVSYSGFLAQRYGRLNRQKVEDFGAELFGIKVSKEQHASVNWGLRAPARGGMISAGVGSGVTGEGADLLIIDDPIKNRAEADSVAYRERIWNEWQSTLIPRLQPGGAVILIQTRWHEDDLAGRLLATEPDEWQVFNLPAQCDEPDNDLLGRQQGEYLWPAYGFDQEWGAKRQKEVGTRAWNALYQQRPAPSTGAILKRHWFNFWCYKGQADQLKAVTLPVPESLGGGYVQKAPEELPEDLESITQSWDMAFKDSKHSSYVVGQVWGAHGARRYVLDQIRKQLDFPATIRAFEQLCGKWPESQQKWIEDKANGPAVISTLQGKIGGIIPVRPEGSKEARGHAISAEVEAGNVYLPHPQLAPWVWDLIEECAVAPYGATDDMFDALTQAISKLAKRKAGGNAPRVASLDTGRRGRRR